MPYVDDASSTLTDEDWQEVVYQRPAASDAPLYSESRIVHFFKALAASMVLQQRKPWSPSRSEGILYPTDILAQKYPHLYIQAMCG